MRALVLDDAVKTFTVDQDKVLSPEETVRRFRARLSAVQSGRSERGRADRHGPPRHPRLSQPVRRGCRAGHRDQEADGQRRYPGPGRSERGHGAGRTIQFFQLRQESRPISIRRTLTELGDRRHFVRSDRPVRARRLRGPRGHRPIFESLPFRWTWAFNLTRGVPVPSAVRLVLRDQRVQRPVRRQLQGGGDPAGDLRNRRASRLVPSSATSASGCPSSGRRPPPTRWSANMLAKYARCGVHLFVSDFTLDMGIPTVGVLAYDPSTFPAAERDRVDRGHHPQPREGPQPRADRGGPAGRGLQHLRQLRRQRSAQVPQRWRTSRYVTRARAEVDLAALPDLSHPNIRVEVENCVSALGRAGYRGAARSRPRTPGWRSRPSTRSSRAPISASGRGRPASAMFAVKHVGRKLPAARRPSGCSNRSGPRCPGNTTWNSTSDWSG